MIRLFYFEESYQLGQSQSDKINFALGRSPKICETTEDKYCRQRVERSENFVDIQYDGSLTKGVFAFAKKQERRCSRNHRRTSDYITGSPVQSFSKCAHSAPFSLS